MMILATGWDTQTKTADPKAKYLINSDHITMVKDCNGYSLVCLSDGHQLYLMDSMNAFKDR